MGPWHANTHRLTFRAWQTRRRFRWSYGYKCCEYRGEGQGQCLRTSVTPALTVNTCTDCRSSLSSSLFRRMCSPLRALSWRLCDEFAGAGGQRSKVRGTPAGIQGRRGLQWGGIQWLEQEGEKRGGEEAEVVSLSVLFDVLHPQGPLFPVWHKTSLLSDVRKS